MYLARESLWDVVSHSPLNVAVLFMHGLGAESLGTRPLREISLAAKELKLVIEVSGIAGLSCDGQEGKLVDVLGQIVAKKHRKDIGGVRANHNFNEA